MTPEDVKKFETLQDLFSHRGWAILDDEFDFKIDSIKEQLTHFGVTEALLAFGQGRISAYREIKGLPNLIEMALKDNVETDSV